MLRMLRYIVILLPMTSCTYNYIESEKTPDLVSYEQHVQPIFNDNCVSCHNGNYAYPNLKDEASYDALMSGNYVDTVTPADSKLILKITDSHYGGTPTSSEIDIITQWIEQGAVNN